MPKPKLSDFKRLLAEMNEEEVSSRIAQIVQQIGASTTVLCSRFDDLRRPTENFERGEGENL